MSFLGLSGGKKCRLLITYIVVNNRVYIHAMQMERRRDPTIAGPKVRRSSGDALQCTTVVTPRRSSNLKIIRRGNRLSCP